MDGNQIAKAYNDYRNVTDYIEMMLKTFDSCADSIKEWRVDTYKKCLLISYKYEDCESLQNVEVPLKFFGKDCFDYVGWDEHIIELTIKRIEEYNRKSSESRQARRERELKNMMELAEKLGYEVCPKK